MARELSSIKGPGNEQFEKNVPAVFFMMPAASLRNSLEDHRERDSGFIGRDIADGVQWPGLSPAVNHDDQVTAGYSIFAELPARGNSAKVVNAALRKDWSQCFHVKTDFAITPAKESKMLIMILQTDESGQIPESTESIFNC